MAAGCLEQGPPTAEGFWSHPFLLKGQAWGCCWGLLLSATTEFPPQEGYSHAIPCLALMKTLAGFQGLHSV